MEVFRTRNGDEHPVFIVFAYDTGVIFSLSQFVCFDFVFSLIAALEKALVPSVLHEFFAKLGYANRKALIGGFRHELV